MTDEKTAQPAPAAKSVNEVSRTDGQKTFNLQSFTEWKKHMKARIQHTMRGYNSVVRGRTVGQFIRESLERDDDLAQDPEVTALGWEESVKSCDALLVEVREMHDRRVTAWRLASVTADAWQDNLAKCWDKLEEADKAFEDARSLSDVIKELKVGMKASASTAKRATLYQRGKVERALVEGGCPNALAKFLGREVGRTTRGGCGVVNSPMPVLQT